jgi:PPOX class probable F420-dependent enzyme
MVGMDPARARQLVTHGRVGRLATVGPDGGPHLVPCCFVLLGDTIYSAIDAKPKSTLALRRLDHIRADPRASLIVDHYEEDWDQLWWVRLDGAARVLDRDQTDAETEAEAAEAGAGIDALMAKYPQYERVAIPGPVIAIDVVTWRAWP